LVIEYPETVLIAVYGILDLASTNGAEPVLGRFFRTKVDAQLVARVKGLKPGTRGMVNWAYSGQFVQ
jgi:hypothetical protein